jgi:hypothetical protein
MIFKNIRQIKFLLLTIVSLWRCRRLNHCDHNSGKTFVGNRQEDIFV